MSRRERFYRVMGKQSAVVDVEQKANNATLTLTPENVRQYFGKSRNYLDIRRYIIDIRRDSVREFTSGRKLDRILDVGCGDGSISVPLLTANNKLTLLDVSDRMLERALAHVDPRNRQNVDVINSEFLAAPLQTTSYDTILCIGVLAHVQAPELVVGKVSSLLLPGGVLVLECTDADNFTNRLTVLLARLRTWLKGGKDYRTRLNSASEVVAICEANGLTLKSTYRYNVALPLMGKFLSQGTLKKLILWIFGTPAKPRNEWLGKECLFLFENKAT